MIKIIKRRSAYLAAVLLVVMVGSNAVAGTLDDIKAKRKIVVGVKYDYPPFGYLDENGDLKGFDLLVADYLASKLGVAPEFKKVTSMDRINTLLAEEVDIVIASMTKTPFRAKMISFTKTYFVDGQGMLVNSSNLLKDENDLDNRIIAVIMGSTGERYVTESDVDFKALALFKSYTDAAEALKAGKVDVVVTDYSWCSAQEKESGGKLVALGSTLTTEPFGIGVRREDDELLDTINALLDQMWKDGSYRKAYQEVFGRDPNFDILNPAGTK